MSRNTLIVFIYHHHRLLDVIVQFEISVRYVHILYCFIYSLHDLHLDVCGTDLVFLGYFIIIKSE
jgi:hypothetical protein